MENNEFGYYAKTVADLVGTKSNTLGTWARELERCGVQFEKNEKAQRIYYDKDLRAFKEMKQLLNAGHRLDMVAERIAEEFRKGTYDKILEDNHALITPSVINTNHALITAQSQTVDFKSEIISSVLDGLKGELASLSQQIQQLQLPQQVDMLPNHSEQDEKLQRILDTVQTLQERPPVDPNASLEEKYQKLLEEHNRIIVAHNKGVEIIQQLVAETKKLQDEKTECENEKMQLEKELAKWKNKPFWKKTP